MSSACCSFYAICLVVLLRVNIATCVRNQRLVVLMIDGMRYDYVDRDTKLKGFPRIAENGVRVKYVTPVFPSVSYPNWYTIGTGLYPESHGMIGNTVHDLVHNRSLHLPPHPSSKEEIWWNRTEPIWVNAEKNWRKTAMHWWDGCRVSIRGIKPDICDPYKEYGPWAEEETRKKMVGLIDWFQENKLNRLGMVYYEGPDAFGHNFGPESAPLHTAVGFIDRILDQFQDHLENSSMKDEVNLIVVSDHGMTDIKSFELIRLSEYNIADDIAMMYGGGPFGHILPKEGKEKKVYESLKKKQEKGLHVYLREEIPEIYHIKHSEYIFPILLVADLGYYIASPTSKRMIVSLKSTGTHGYDPYVQDSPMRTIMYARGPAFKTGVVGEPIEQVDHYNLFCHILGIQPQPNNGSWDRVKDLLVDRQEIVSMSSSDKTFGQHTFLLMLTFIYFILVIL